MGTINVNCVHFKHPCRCTCEDADVPGTWLSWLLGKSCVLLDRCVSVCLHQRMHPRPEPPKASVPPPQIAGGQRPTVHLFAAMDPPPTKPWTMTATCPKCQHQFVIGEMKPMKCGVPIPEDSMPSGGEAPMVKAGESVLGKCVCGHDQTDHGTVGLKNLEPTSWECRHVFCKCANYREVKP